MTASPSSATPPQAPRSRGIRLVAAGAAVSVAATGIALAGAGPAAAAATPYAQSVGRFLDGAVGGKALQALADLKDARASAPGRQSQQNPLGARALGQMAVPLGHALQLPSGGVFSVGAVNQVAVARNGGFSYGASGAVSNSGGASLGGDNGAYPADAKIDLSAKSLGSVRVPGLPRLPGVPRLPGGKAAALGDVSADVGAISALAKTQPGGAFATPVYKIASLNLALTSPALAALLKQLAAGGANLQSALDTVTAALKKLGLTLPASCTIEPGSLPTKITLDHGAVVLDPATGSLTIDLQALLRLLGANLNALPPNTDLLAYVLNNLAAILSKGLAHVVNGLVTPIENLGSGCVTDLGALPGIGLLVKKLVTTLQSGQPKLEKALEQIAAQLSGATGPGLTQLTSQLAKVVAIGVNVQQGAFPLSSEPSPKYRFTSPLRATPDQATVTVPGQGVVRALEIDLLGTRGADLALGNAAAGPSSAPTAPPTTAPPSVPSTAVPTGVPAGAAADNGGSGPLPLIVLLVVLGVGGGAALGLRNLRMRGRFSR